MELCSGYSLSHGKAVSMGLAAMARACAHRGVCPEGTAERIVAALEKTGLPTVLPYGAGALAAAAVSDKKRRGSRLPLVVVDDIGRCRVETVPGAELEDWLREGGAK